MKFHLSQKKCLLMFTLFCFFASNVWAAKLKQISYKDEGQGTTLVFIHAFPTDQRLWLPQQQVLKNYFRIITLDLWGFGQSEAVDGQAITMQDYADEVKQLLDNLHIQQAIIAGESMGGYIALAFLEKYPQQVAGLILSDTQTIADSEETKANRETSAQEILAHGATAFLQNFIGKALSADAAQSTKDFLQDIVTSQSVTAIASALRGMALRQDTSKVLAETEVPILILTGEQDGIISVEQSKTMQKLAKRSELIVLSHAGHLANLEQPQAWNDAVIKKFY
jgi:pimeloyl-ACP methyl ester carboxylesterase